MPQKLQNEYDSENDQEPNTSFYVLYLIWVNWPSSGNGWWWPRIRVNTLGSPCTNFQKNRLFIVTSQRPENHKYK